MLESEAQLKEQIAALLDKVRATDTAKRGEPELDIPAEILRREQRLEVIRAARARLESRQRELDAATCRSGFRPELQRPYGSRRPCANHCGGKMNQQWR